MQEFDVPEKKKLSNAETDRISAHNFFIANFLTFPSPPLSNFLIFDVPYVSHTSVRV